MFQVPHMEVPHMGAFDTGKGLLMKRACINMHYSWEKKLQPKELNYNTRYRQQKASETINTGGRTKRLRKRN